MYVQYGFLYLILTRPKFAVLYKCLMHFRCILTWLGTNKNVFDPPIK
jgi:hypothetical protein